MGKGDKKSKKGKIIMGSYGRTRLAKKRKPVIAVAAPVEVEKKTKATKKVAEVVDTPVAVKEPKVKKTAEKKVTAEKATAKKTTAKKTSKKEESEKDEQQLSIF